MEKLSGVYRIRNKVNGKFYIGRSIDINKRFYQHKSALRKGKHGSIYLQRAWDKYGEDNFIFEPLVLCSEDESLILEQYVLDNYKTDLYNVMKYSTGGDTISYHPNREQIRAKISNTLKEINSKLTFEERVKKYAHIGPNNGRYGKPVSDHVREAVRKHSLGNQYAKGVKRTPEHRALLSKLAKQRTGVKNPFYGKKHTEETRRKLSEKQKGKKPANSRKIKIDNVIYESQADAARALNVSKATISYRLKNPDKYPNYTRI